MEEIIETIERLLSELGSYVETADAQALVFKKDAKKWSKKEILGHLIDSGTHNLHRFIEITEEDKPYRVRSYQQDVMVRENDYQQMETADLLTFLLLVNGRIIVVLRKQTTQNLAHPIILSDGKPETLHFLIEDYVSHLAHHCKQIIA
jgi:hypothetical protein